MGIVPFVLPAFSNKSFKMISTTNTNGLTPMICNSALNLCFKQERNF